MEELDSRLQMYQMAGRMIFDKEFRVKAIEDPVGAAGSMDLYLTPEQADHIRSLDVDGLDSMLDDLTKIVGIVVYRW